MQTLKLISEAVEEVEYITEEKDGKKNYKIKGVFMQADIKNRKVRVYPQEVLQKDVEKYNKNFSLDPIFIFLKKKKIKQKNKIGPSISI